MVKFNSTSVANSEDNKIQPVTSKLLANIGVHKTEERINGKGPRVMAQMLKGRERGKWTQNERYVHELIDGIKG